METEHACLPTAVYRFKVSPVETQSWVSLLLPLLRILHLLLLLKLYSLLWNLASNTIFLHSTLFLAIVFLFYYSHNLYPFQPFPSIFYMVLLFSFFLSFYLLQLVWVFFGLAFFQHDHNISVRGILYIPNYLFPVVCPLSPCLDLFFSVPLTLGSIHFPSNLPFWVSWLLPWFYPGFWPVSQYGSYYRFSLALRDMSTN